MSNRHINYCSFCGKNQDEVDNLIAGPQVFICNECVALCNEICDPVKKGIQEYDSWSGKQS